MVLDVNPRGVEAALVRIPRGAPLNRAPPSNMFDKILHIIGWFER